MNPHDELGAVAHPLRVEILKLLAKGPRRFVDIKRELKVDTSGLLDFHLKKLGDLISINNEGHYVLSEKGFAALQAIETLSKYGWQKRAFYLNLLVCIMFNVYFLLVGGEWLSIVLVVTAAWMAFYGYWTFVKRHIPLKGSIV
ncbi:MAG: DUF7347 domain-containing protein [Thermoproteota archaeon]